MKRTAARFVRLMVVGVLAAGVLVACGGSDGSDGGASADPSKDKLAQILARGTLVGYLEADYPPQSMEVKGATRPAGHEVRRQPAHRHRGHGLRQRDDEAGRQGAWRRGVLRRADVDRGHGRQLGRPLGHRVRLGLDQRRPDAAAVHDAAVLRRARTTTSSRRSSGAARDDLDGKRIGSCAELLARALPEGRARDPGGRHRLNVKDPKLVTFETEAPGSRRPPRARSTRSSLPSRSARRRSRRGGAAAAARGRVHLLPLRLRRQELGPRLDGVRRPGQRDRPGRPGRRDAERALDEVVRPATTSPKPRRTTSTRSIRR